MKKSSILYFILLSSNYLFAQYDNNLVQLKSVELKGEIYSVVRMTRKDNRIKVKYFASKSPDGQPVSKRFQDWRQNKNIIAYSSGTYMTDYTQNTMPIGLCIDAGNIINRSIAPYDGLAIVYATGGMVVTDIKQKNLTIQYKGFNENIDVTSALDRIKLFNWGSAEGATIFQTHLFVYKDNIKVYQNSSNKLAERRFLAVCKGEDDNIYHYIINLPDASTILNGVQKAKDYLIKMENIKELTYLINLDTGAQDIFGAFDKNGEQISSPRFQGKVKLPYAVNLLVYYYE